MFSGISSSHVSSSFQSCCRKSLPRSNQPARYPIGSKTDMTADITERLVATPGGRCTRYVSMSGTGFQATPRALRSSSFPRVKSSLLHCSGRSWPRIFGEFDVHGPSSNPPPFNVSVRFLISSIASSSVFVPVMMSST